MLRSGPLILLTALTLGASSHFEYRHITLFWQGQPILAEVASSSAARSKGLMGRKSLAQDQGMLFAQDTLQIMCFWMKNTPLALSIAFLSDEGEVLAVAEMAPMSLDRHCSPVPVRYALEMPGGWFSAHGVEAGSRLSGAAFHL